MDEMRMTNVGTEIRRTGTMETAADVELRFTQQLRKG
jgi:hypothetical protein